MAYLSPLELVRIAGLRPELRALVLPLEQAIEDATGKTVVVPPHGGVRSSAVQAELYAARDSNPYPVAAPGFSRHEYGAAVDLDILGGTDDDYATMARIATDTFGLDAGYPNDPPHLQLRESLADSQAAWRALQQQRELLVVVAVAGVAIVVWSGAQTHSRR